MRYETKYQKVTQKSKGLAFPTTARGRNKRIITEITFTNVNATMPRHKSCCGHLPPAALPTRATSVHRPLGRVSAKRM